MNDDYSALATTVIGLIADTFDVSQASITLATEADDIPGWDSLGHSVLLVRLSRRLRVQVTEENATSVANVGELVERLEMLRMRVAS